MPMKVHATNISETKHDLPVFAVLIEY